MTRDRLKRQKEYLQKDLLLLLIDMIDEREDYVSNTCAFHVTELSRHPNMYWNNVLHMETFGSERHGNWWLRDWELC